MNPKKETYKKLADTIIKNLNKRNMEGYYCGTSAEAVQLAMSMMPEGSSVSFGGSMTFVETGIARVRNFATPPNVTRLGLHSPCSVTGHCMNCTSPDCICAQIVITRYSRHAGRIKVILIGEELGY